MPIPARLLGGLTTLPAATLPTATLPPATVTAAAEGPAMPVAARVVVVVVLLLVAAAALTTAALTRSGSLRRTGRAGVRTPASLASDESFATANRTAAPFLVLAGVFAILAAVLVGATGLRGSGGVLALVGCGVVVGGLLVLGAARGERAARLVLTRSGAAAASPPGTRTTTPRVHARPGGSPGRRRRR